MLGQDVASAATVAGHEVTALGRGELDITDETAVGHLVARARPELVVNCAAWTDVDAAEGSPDAARAVNDTGAGHLARAATAAGAWTFHVSTDYVFDGSKGAPYLESDSPNPASQYGFSKLAGEQSVARAAPDSHTIVRTSWLFGAGGKSFPATILRLASERDELSVVDDQVGCPTFSGHFARALVELGAGPPLGILHVAGGGQCSWYELALEVIGRAGEHCQVRRGRTADLGRPAPRPAFSVLRSERGAPALADWRDGIAAFMESGVPS